MQSFRRRRQPGHRRSIVPGGPEAGFDGTGLPDQPIDPGKGRIAGPTPEGRMESKTQGAHRLIRLLEEHVQNPGDLVVKARIYNETVAKIGGPTALKLIHICVDYSVKMETILAEMRILFDNRNRFFRGSSIPLEKVPDLTEFPDLPPMEVLQNLQMPTTLRTNQESAESGERPALGSDARTFAADKRQQEVPIPIPGPTSTPVPELAPTPEV